MAMCCFSPVTGFTSVCEKYLNRANPTIASASRTRAPHPKPRRRGASESPMALSRHGVVIGGLGPVDDGPPGFDVVRPAVLVLEVIGVFPDVETENGLAAVHPRRVLVRRGLDHELAVADEQPRPARPESPDARGSELGLELRERPERRVDRFLEIALGLPAAPLLHERPEHRVIEMAAA